MARFNVPLHMGFVRYTTNWKYSLEVLSSLAWSGIILSSQEGYFDRATPMYSLTSKGYELLGKLDKLNDICSLEKL